MDIKSINSNKTNNHNLNSLNTKHNTTYGVGNPAWDGHDNVAGLNPLMGWRAIHTRYINNNKKKWYIILFKGLHSTVFCLTSWKAAVGLFSVSRSWVSNANSTLLSESVSKIDWLIDWLVLSSLNSTYVRENRRDNRKWKIQRHIGNMMACTTQDEDNQNIIKHRRKLKRWATRTPSNSRWWIHVFTKGNQFLSPVACIVRTCWIPLYARQNK